MATLTTLHATGGIRDVKSVSEAVRERETFRYDPTLFASFRFNNSGQLLPSSELISCNDSILTGLAQLGAYQTRTERSFISLFDASHQFVVTEVMPSMRLEPSLPSHDCPSPLSLCGNAIPRRYGTCEHVLYNVGGPDTKKGQLPISVVPNLTTDDRFNQRPYCQFGDGGQFYAAVPIRTQRGINIGSYCVLSTKQPDSWGEQSVQSMTDISLAIMDHLETKRTTNAHRQSERMNRGLGSFVEGKSTLSGWQSGPNVAAFADKADKEGALDATQQYRENQPPKKENDDQLGKWNAASELPNSASLGSRLDAQSEAFTSASKANVCIPTSPQDSRLLSRPLASDEPKQNLKFDSSGGGTNKTFSKASNIIREAFEVAGCSFFDVTVGSYRAPTVQVAADGSDTTLSPSQMSPNSSSDEQPDLPPTKGSDAVCELLGFSTTEGSSINAAKPVRSHARLGKRLLAKLLRRYPKGKIFNYDAVGELHSSDSSEDDDTRRRPSREVIPAQYDGDEGESSAAAAKRKKKLLRSSRAEEGALIREAFPTARSVVFFPVWDSRRERWCAGGFIYTLDPVRIFTVEGDLVFLEAFAKLITAEVHSTEAARVDKAKSDALGALSHELRSPLHGVMLSTELLNDTDLDVFQGNLTHTIETCCRTLLDTIDHLLDYSKVNSFTAMQKQVARGAATNQHKKRSRSHWIEHKKLHAHTSLDGIVEEVVESMFAGFNFQHMSVRQLSKQGKGGFTDSAALKSLDFAHAMEQLSPTYDGKEQHGLHFGDVSVFISIDPNCDWMFYMQAGAIRRIVMNLVGNALKYTNTGAVRISLSQEPQSHKGSKSERMIKLTVEDTGKGISHEYLQHKLFKPFTQEDELAPGTGLGLSLVKKIVSQIRGHIQVKSQIGVGSTIIVTFPLEQSPQSADMSEDDQVFEEQLRDLSGLRVRLVGFESWGSGASGVHSSLTNGSAIVETICRQSLHLELVNDEAKQGVPDLVLWSSDALPAGFANDLQLSKAPNIIVCKNALVAYQRASTSDCTQQGGVFEFVSQPIGPRKLAMSLHLAYKRWMGLPRSPPSPSLLPSRPPGPFRVRSSHEAWAPLDAAMAQNGDSPDSAAHSIVGPLPILGGVAHADLPASLPKSLGEVGSSEQIEPEQGNVRSKLLLVDDNHINLKVLAAYVRKLGREYETATNGKEALDAYIQHPSHFAGILMDISMPVMDGLEATRQIRAFEQRSYGAPSSVPVLALTGLASDEVYHEALESGVNVFLTKPVRLAKLSEALEAMGILQSPQDASNVKYKGVEQIAES